MDSRKPSTIGRNLLLLLGQLIVLASCIAYIEFVYHTKVLPDKKVYATFNETVCTIASERMSTQGNNFRADFLLNYSVDDKPYNTWVSANGLDNSFSADKKGQQEVLDQFVEGQNYPCWVDPHNPNIAVLVLRHEWSATFPLIIPSIILLIDAYYLLINLFRIFGAASKKMREK
jgi:hypothetical protein